MKLFVPVFAIGLLLLGCEKKTNAEKKIIYLISRNFDKEIPVNDIKLKKARKDYYVGIVERGEYSSYYFLCYQTEKKIELTTINGDGTFADNTVFNDEIYTVNTQLKKNNLHISDVYKVNQKLVLTLVTVDRKSIYKTITVSR